MISFATIIQWAVLACTPAPNVEPTSACVAEFAQCMWDGVQDGRDPDWVFEECATDAPPVSLLSGVHQ